MNSRTLIVVTAVVLASGCEEASVRLALSNQTIAQGAQAQGFLADGTSLRLKMIAAYLVEDVDPLTQHNLGATAMVWLNPECGGAIDGCNIEGFELPVGPRISSFFDLARPTAEVNAELNSQDTGVSPGSYHYARVELCKASGQSQASAPTMMWSGPGMTAEQPFSSGDCGRTSLRFDPPLELADGDAVEVTLGYDLAAAIVSGRPASADQGGSFSIAGHTDPGGTPHAFRACVDVNPASRVCMDFPEFAPSATKL